jgi:hypothetical protein
VKVVFPANPPDRPSWPYVGYDVEKRSKEVLSVLGQQLPEFEFSAGVYYSTEEAERAFQAKQDQYDGYLAYMTAMWSGIAEYYVRNARPVIVADELYSGSGGLLRIYSLMKKEHLPAIGVASSDFQDVVDAVRLLGVMSKMRQASILVVADGETWGARQKTLSNALLIRCLTGRPGYVSDPVIDTATGQIVYVHCVATNRAFGQHGSANPYVDPLSR